jgi:predicted nucleic acid-binding protein
MQKFIFRTGRVLIRLGGKRWMVNKAFEINKYIFKQDEVLLLDANIWLYLFPAPSSPNHYGTEIYSSVFKAILKAKSRILISGIVLSEYVNRYCRIEWSATYKIKYPNFKDFRQSKDYFQVGRGAAQYVQKILKFSHRIDDGFVELSIQKIIDSIRNGSADINDSFIVESCCKNNCKLITHDGDFVNGGIEILTANGKLLATCAV